MNADLALELQLRSTRLCRETSSTSKRACSGWQVYRLPGPTKASSSVRIISSMETWFIGESRVSRLRADQFELKQSVPLPGLTLSGERVKYRIVLAGDPEISVYSEVEIEISINDVGYRGSGQRLRCVPRSGQFNFRNSISNAPRTGPDDQRPQRPLFGAVQLSHSHAVRGNPSGRRTCGRVAPADQIDPAAGPQCASVLNCQAARKPFGQTETLW